MPETSSADDAFLIAAQLEDLGQAPYERLADGLDGAESDAVGRILAEERRQADLRATRDRLT